jgi:hypothetical protein
VQEEGIALGQPGIRIEGEELVQVRLGGSAEQEPLGCLDRARLRAVALIVPVVHRVSLSRGVDRVEGLAGRCVAIEEAAGRCVLVEEAAGHCLPIEEAAGRCLPVEVAAGRCLPVEEAAKRSMLVE